MKPNHTSFGNVTDTLNGKIASLRIIFSITNGSIITTNTKNRHNNILVKSFLVPFPLNTAFYPFYSIYLLIFKLSIIFLLFSHKVIISCLCYYFFSLSFTIQRAASSPNTPFIKYIRNFFISIFLNCGRYVT